MVLYTPAELRRHERFLRKCNRYAMAKSKATQTPKQAVYEPTSPEKTMKVDKKTKVAPTVAELNKRVNFATKPGSSQGSRPKKAQLLRVTDEWLETYTKNFVARLQKDALLESEKRSYARKKSIKPTGGEQLQNGTSLQH